jgi:hypothetical protein
MLQKNIKGKFLLSASKNSITPKKTPSNGRKRVELMQKLTFLQEKLTLIL